MPRHLIHIGYPKSGSTFLQEWFRQHPDLCYAPGGLGGFGDVYSLCRLPEREYRYYVTSFEGLSTPHRDAGGIRLDWSDDQPAFSDPIKTDQARVCDLLRTLYPDSRILVVTRGFRDLMISGYSQYVRSGGVLHLAAMSAVLAEHSRTDASHYFDFDYLIRLYTEAFGEENVIVLPYELLRDDQAKFLAVLEETLGLAHVEVELGRVNPSLSPEELYWYPVISRLVAAAASRLGRARFERLYRRYAATVPFHNRLRLLIRLLARLKPDGRIGRSDFPASALRYCVGKATLLRNRPLYAPYGREYLWEEEPAGEEVAEPLATVSGDGAPHPARR